jgi:hypothetical protein
MATGATINGTNLIVQVNGTAISLLKECDIDMTNAGRDITTKDSAGWSEEAPDGKRSWKISGKGDVADKQANFTALFALYNSRASCSVSFAITGSGEKWYYGTGILKTLKENAPLEETTTFDFEFTGSGILTEGTHT